MLERVYRLEQKRVVTIYIFHSRTKIELTINKKRKIKKNFLQVSLR